MHSVSKRNRPEGLARGRPWRWPGGDAELPSNSAARRRRWRKRSQSRSPTATAKLTCRSPSSHEPLRRTLRGQGKVEGWPLVLLKPAFPIKDIKQLSGDVNKQQWYLLVPEHHAFDAGTKQHHTRHVWTARHKDGNGVSKKCVGLSKQRSGFVLMANMSDDRASQNFHFEAALNDLTKQSAVIA